MQTAALSADVCVMQQAGLQEGWEEGVACSKDAFALAELVGVLCSDLSLAGGVGQGEDQRLLNMLAHLLYHLLHSRLACHDVPFPPRGL